jgi:hypothetical protein
MEFASSILSMFSVGPSNIPRVSTSQARDLRALAREEERWVGVFFDDKVLTFPEISESWKLGAKLCTEKCNKASIPSYATGVYECTQVKGSNPGRVAVLKIHMQYALPTIHIKQVFI